MAQDDSQSQEVDLERTDQLPLLPGTLVDDDVADDAVRLDYSPVVPSVKADFARGPVLDLPSLAESVRSVEERIARQSAEYEALDRAYERARDAEAAATLRGKSLEGELAAVRAQLGSEQARSREVDKTLGERAAAAEASRARTEEILREVERHQSESRTLRETLAARDAAIGQALHTLGERDEQLSALQREHARVVPALEERTGAAAELETELRAARAGVVAGREELDSTRRELNALKMQSAAYLEHLRTREWRRGFDENLFRELDAKIGAAQGDHGALQSELDQLRQRVTDLEAQLAARDDALAGLKAALTDGDALRAGQEQQLRQVDSARVELMQQIVALENDRAEWQEQLAKRDVELERRDAEMVKRDADREKRDAVTAEALAAAGRADQRSRELLAAAELARAELAKEVAGLRSDAQTREDEMAVLLAHLQQARRPDEAVQAEHKRLTDELDAKVALIEQLNEDNRATRAALERTRGALEEREFLIRRLERSESNNANVLGRIQTSIERLGSPGGGAALPLECSAELVRIDGPHPTQHVLGRRTRIGRAPGCELQIDSSSVSRHHALVLMSARDVIIEDLNSTNGVLVNGRKVSRQLLRDGDVLTIGEVQFRLSLKLTPPALESPSDPS